MPNLDADRQDRILFQQLLADDCRCALRAIPEIKTTADAVGLSSTTHDGFAPSKHAYSSVCKRWKDSQTAAIDTFKAMLGTSWNRCLA